MSMIIKRNQMQWINECKHLRAFKRRQGGNPSRESIEKNSAVLCDGTWHRQTWIARIQSQFSNVQSFPFFCSFRFDLCGLFSPCSLNHARGHASRSIVGRPIGYVSLMVCRFCAGIKQNKQKHDAFIFSFIQVILVLFIAIDCRTSQITLFTWELLCFVTWKRSPLSVMVCIGFNWFNFEKLFSTFNWHQLYKWQNKTDIINSVGNDATMRMALRQNRTPCRLSRNWSIWSFVDGTEYVLKNEWRRKMCVFFFAWIKGKKTWQKWKWQFERHTRNKAKKMTFTVRPLICMLCFPLVKRSTTIKAKLRSMSITTASANKTDSQYSHTRKRIAKEYHAANAGEQIQRKRKSICARTCVYVVQTKHIIDIWFTKSD